MRFQVTSTNTARRHCGKTTVQSEVKDHEFSENRREIYKWEISYVLLEGYRSAALLQKLYFQLSYERGSWLNQP